MNGIPPEPSDPPGASGAKRGLGSVIIGAVLVLVGVPMLILPGPGALTVAAGVGLIATGLRLRRDDQR